jgi:hypothetical protein
VAQYVPDVTEADVGRVVRRDYAPLGRAGVPQERQRRLRKLKGELEGASGWWREMISAAEYPNYTKKMFRIDMWLRR